MPIYDNLSYLLVICGKHLFSISNSRSFRTEVRDNYVPKPCKLESKIYSNEDKIKTLRSKTIAGLKTNSLEDDYCLKLSYDTENSRTGSGKSLCTIFDPYVDKNKRLENINREKDAQKAKRNDSIICYIGGKQNPRLNKY